jgi:preprotein translocase subunit SecA
VTVATNMAGRGVDIILGGSPDGEGQPEWSKDHDRVVELGGLHIVGTERHEARRIDNQLRGRAGRQGDPGSSRFYVSLEDDVVRRFGGDRIKGLMDWAGMDENTPIENALVSKAIENAQVKVEGYHFDIRKHLVDYDDVVNKQRELVYGERRKILSGADLKTNILAMIKEEIQALVANHTGNGRGYDWDINGLIAETNAIFPLSESVNTEALSQMQTARDIEQSLFQQAEARYEERENEVGPENMRMLERLIMLRITDSLWMEHLTIMDSMRQGIGLQAMAQRDPLVAYKREGHNLFQNLLANIQRDVVHTIYHVGFAKKEATRKVPVAAPAGGGNSRPQAKAGGRKVGRNEPCPCGSGKKYKHCCGR